MFVTFSCERIEEAVTLDGAPTVVGIRENRKTLEAELGHTAPAHHLVTLLPLRPLRGNILLAHAHLTLRTLLGPCAFHPAHEAFVGSLRILLAAPQLRRIFLASEALVVRRDLTAEARASFALRAMAQIIVPILNLIAHVAARCWAGMKVGRGGNSATDASVVEAVDDILQTHAFQVMIWNWCAAIRT